MVMFVFFESKDVFSILLQTPTDIVVLQDRRTLTVSSNRKAPSRNAVKQQFSIEGIDELFRQFVAANQDKYSCDEKAEARFGNTGTSGEQSRQQTIKFGPIYDETNRVSLTVTVYHSGAISPQVCANMIFSYKYFVFYSQNV